MGKTYGGHYFNSYTGHCAACGKQRHEVDGKECAGADDDAE